VTPGAETQSQTIEEYVETIHRFSGRPEGASTTGLAKHLGVRPATVSGMLKRLAELGLITYRRYRHIALTEKGERLAHDVIKRHRLMERLLTDVLKVPLAEAHEEACRLEHAVSPGVAARLAEALGSPKSCPHGHPVDASSKDDTIPLPDAPTDRALTIARLEDETAEVVRYLADRGLLPGRKVTLREVEPLSATVVIEAGGKRHTLGYQLAASIRVGRPKRRGKG